MDPGKYVRAPRNDSEAPWGWHVSDGEEEEEVMEAGVESDLEDERPDNRFLRAMRDENRDYLQRMNEFQNALSRMQGMFAVNQLPNDGGPLLRNENWARNNIGANPERQGPTSGIRYDNIQPFPEDVPASRMWEEWNRFIDRFEVAASFSNVNDQVKRAQMLFLSMGPKLQRISKAARLRPNLDDPNVYANFVQNIEQYLRSMVDITAEHEAFSNLKQGPDEPTITFHARLMEKVRLCRYSEADEDRFVRMQLLKGMKNRDLAKTARTFAYGTSFIVQAATREEAHTVGTTTEPRSEPLEAFVITRGKSFREQSAKRRSEEGSDNWKQQKRRRDEEKAGQRYTGSGRRYSELGRRSRCTKCNKLFHKFGSCPANSRNCDKCGKLGHFAATCHEIPKANQIEVRGKVEQRSGWTDGEGEVINNKL